MALEKRPGFWTHDDEAAGDVGHLYYFAPADRSPPPYKTQRRVTAIIDVASDGTLGGVELIDDMPPPPAQKRCGICGAVMSAGEDLGGDCLKCMTEAGDPEALAQARLERVARAICKSVGRDPDIQAIESPFGPPIPMPPGYAQWQNYVDEARAAIDAILNGEKS